MSPIFRFGLPGDAAAWVALIVAAILAVAWRTGRKRVLARPRLVAFGLAALACALSSLYVHFYLRGGPRIIDATSYFLEAKALARGAFSFEPLMPSSAFRGRFLTGPVGETSLSVIFPPGYPLLLALGFVLDKPMWIGPLLAFVLVLLTYQLSLRLFRQQAVALGAAAFSAICGTLRYHTADTMSHAWAALLLAGCLLALTYQGHLASLLAGLAAGWLMATRPVTGALCAVLAVYVLRVSWRTLSFAIASLPGLLLLAWHQRAATGQWLTSAQLHYYLASDGPPGCFKYGFGSSVGCLHEHGDVVKRYLAEGFGLSEAIVTSVHRLHWHTLDLANLELLWLVLPYAVFVGRRLPQVRLLGIATFGIIIAYAPFYFNGSYPGGGARLLADVLPLEHILLAWGLSQLNGFRIALPLALAGFSVHAGYSHQALAAREGGQPMFAESELEKRGIDHGLVLVNTDHGFNLAFDPMAQDAHAGIVSARSSGDARDRVLWESLGRPPAYRYRFAPWSANSGPEIQRAAIDLEPVLLFEAENDWPPLRVSHGYAHPTHVGAACASKNRVLQLVPTADQALKVELEAAVLEHQRYHLRVGWLRPAASDAAGFTLELGNAVWTSRIQFDNSDCAVSNLGVVRLKPGTQRILLSVQQSAKLDYILLTPASIEP